MLSNLDGRLIKQLHAAILDGFDHAELTLFARSELNARLDEISLNVQGLSDVVIALVSWAERRGRIPDLLDALVAARPTVPMFGHLRDELSMRLKSGSAAPTDTESSPPPTAFGPGVRSAEPAAIVQWAQALARASRGICLLEVGDAPSTACAIAPRLVLCPHGILEPLLDGTRQPHEVRVTFGWQAPIGDPAKLVGVWELDPEMPIVDHDADLGFGLLLLGAPAPPDGASMLAEQVAALQGVAAPVSPVDVSGARPAADGQLFLLAQAMGQPVEVETAFAVDAQEPDRLVYRTDGQDRAGRIGAPVFDARWRVVGLHLDAEVLPDGTGRGRAVAMASILARPTVKVALAVAKPPPETMLAQMAI